MEEEKIYEEEHLKNILKITRGKLKRRKNKL